MATETETTILLISISITLISGFGLSIYILIEKYLKKKSTDYYWNKKRYDFLIDTPMSQECAKHWEISESQFKNGLRHSFIRHHLDTVNDWSNIDFVDRLELIEFAIHEKALYGQPRRGKIAGSAYYGLGIEAFIDQISADEAYIRLKRPSNVEKILNFQAVTKEKCQTLLEEYRKLKEGSSIPGRSKLEEIKSISNEYNEFMKTMKAPLGKIPKSREKFLENERKKIEKQKETAERKEKKIEKKIEKITEGASYSEKSRLFTTFGGVYLWSISFLGLYLIAHLLRRFGPTVKFYRQDSKKRIGDMIKQGNPRLWTDRKDLREEWDGMFGMSFISSLPTILLLFLTYINFRQTEGLGGFTLSILRLFLLISCIFVVVGYILEFSALREKKDGKVSFKAFGETIFVSISLFLLAFLASFSPLFIVFDVLKISTNDIIFLVWLSYLVLVLIMPIMVFLYLDHKFNVEITQHFWNSVAIIHDNLDPEESPSLKLLISDKFRYDMREGSPMRIGKVIQVFFLSQTILLLLNLLLA